MVETKPSEPLLRCGRCMARLEADNRFEQTRQICGCRPLAPLINLQFPPE